MITVVQSTRFHLRHAWFNVREQFSDLGSGIAGFLLFPFFIWLIARLWGKFNAYQGNYTFDEILRYVGVTEILFMTFLRPDSFSRASGDFSLSLARPRSWLATSFSGVFGRCLGSRLVYLGLFVAFLPLLGADSAETAQTALRLLLLLPLLGVFQSFVGIAFASAQVLWAETSYFILPVSKVFLALGGVFGPLADYGEPWRSRLILLPPSDVFFQVGHFCVKGSFYQISFGQWFMRIAWACIAMGIFNLAFHRHARSHHQSYGG